MASTMEGPVPLSALCQDFRTPPATCLRWASATPPTGTAGRRGRRGTTPAARGGVRRRRVAPAPRHARAAAAEVGAAGGGRGATACAPRAGAVHPRRCSSRRREQDDSVNFRCGSTKRVRVRVYNALVAVEPYSTYVKLGPIVPVPKDVLLEPNLLFELHAFHVGKPGYERYFTFPETKYVGWQPLPSPAERWRWIRSCHSPEEARVRGVPRAEARTPRPRADPRAGRARRRRASQLARPSWGVNGARRVRSHSVSSGSIESQGDGARLGR